MTSPRALSFSNIPDRLIAQVPGLSGHDAATLATEALGYAQHAMPRVTGFTASRLTAQSGPNFFGLAWADPYVWFQENGTRPYLMRNLAGKTIPMWINDPLGKLRDANPKARTRVTEDGRHQTLIFRRAAKPGERKMAWRNTGVRWRTVGGQRVREPVQERVSVPKSYPGAPGRIRAIETEHIPGARVRPGQIATGNVGVRWRHPGLGAGHYIENAIRRTTLHWGIHDPVILPYFGRELRQAA